MRRQILVVYNSHGTGVAQSVCLTTDWETGVWFPEEALDFSSSLCVQISSEAHLAFYPTGIGAAFSKVKCGRSVTLTITPA
jgi:hypothetical protein